MTSISPSMWLAQEQVRLRAESPRFWAFLQLASRFRIPILVLVAAVSGGFMQLQSLSVADTTYFIHASHRLFSGDGLNVFQDPGIQVGPLYLAALGLMGALADAVRLSPVFVDGFLQAGLVSWLCVQLVRALAPDDARKTQRDLGIGVSLIFGPLAGVGVAGHFEEPLIAAFLLLAALRASQGRDVSAALWLVLASGFKLSGLLGVPILLIAASWPALLRRTAIFAVVCGALYLPFFAWGTVNTFHFSWPVWPSATVGWFVSGHPFSWQLRMLQGALTVAAGCWIALRRSAPVWATPVVLIAVRLLLDPEQVPYYWVALVLCLVVAGWSTVQERLTQAWLLTTVGALLALSMPYFSGDRTTRFLHTVALAAVLIAVVRLSVRRPAEVKAR